MSPWWKIVVLIAESFGSSDGILQFQAASDSESELSRAGLFYFIFVLPPDLFQKDASTAHKYISTA
jgi:hypothetical protein